MPALARAARTGAVRDAVAAVVPTRWANTVVITRPCASTTGPPELPLRIDAADRRHSPADGKLPYASRPTIARCGRRGRPSRAYGPFPGSRGARRGSLDGVGEPQRRRLSPATRRTATSLRLVERDDAARRAGRRRCGRRGASSTPATTCALVTTRPVAATQPEPSIPSPHALPTTRTTLGAALLTPAESSTAGSGGADARRPGRRAGERVDLRERVDQSMGGSSSLRVERIAESWA